MRTNGPASVTSAFVRVVLAVRIGFASGIRRREVLSRAFPRTSLTTFSLDTLLIGTSSLTT